MPASCLPRGLRDLTVITNDFSVFSHFTAVRAQVAVGRPRTQRTYAADGETTPQPRHAFASGGVTGAAGLRWLHPKMTVALSDAEPGNAKSPARLYAINLYNSHHI